LTIKDPEKHFLKDIKDSLSSVILEINVARCHSATSNVECKSDEEALAYLEKFNIHLSTLINFIDYENVDPGVGPIKRTASTVELFGFDPQAKDVRFHSFIESQIELEDSLFQILTEPAEFSLLNLDKNSFISFENPAMTNG
jgi:hypothetical protein